MKNLIPFSLLFVISFLMGCSGSDSTGTQTPHTHLEVVQSAIHNYHVSAELIQSITNAESGEQAILKIKDQTQELFQLIQKLTKLGPASSEEKARIRRKSPNMSREGAAIRDSITELLAKLDSGTFPSELSHRLRTTSKEYFDAMNLFGKHGDKLLE
jgi:hypothetical protein